MEIAVDVLEQAFGWDPDKPQHQGFIVVEPTDPPTLVARIRPGLDRETRDMFGVWALQRFGRFFEHGPEPDGWQRRSDGGWQLWAALVQMPVLD